MKFPALVSSFLTVSSLAAADLSADFHSRIQPLLKSYCLDCHNAEKQKGDVDLTPFTSLSGVQADFKLWQTVLRQVEEEEMPPKKPLPSGEERAELAAWVRAALDWIDWSKQSGVGRVTLPRLTKPEYNNTLRDLLGVDLRPGDQLLDDGQGLSGFSNDRDALFISPALAEQLFDAADYALQAVLDLRQKPVTRQYEAEKMLMTERGSKPETLPGGGVGYSLAGAGQRTLYDEITAPADGWYQLTVRHVGLGGDSGMRLRIDNEPRADFNCADETAKEETVELLLRAGTHQMTWNIEVPRALQKPKTSAPAPVAAKRKAKNYPVFDQKAVATGIRDAAEKNAPQLPPPAAANAETAKLVDQLNRGLVGMQMRLEYLRAVTPEGDPSDLRSYYNLLPERTQAMAAIKAQLAAVMKLPEIEIDQRLTQANPEKFADNQKVLADSLAVIGVEFSPAFLFGGSEGAAPPKPKRVGAPGVDWIRIEGPLLPKGAQPELVNALYKEDADAALRAFLPRAFRRPLKAGELERHRQIYQTTVKRGEPHDQALKLAFSAALTSTNFLFRDELGANAQGFTLDDHQLACRLSYFLWMSMPDDELLRLADAGKLNDDAVLRAQVKRMIADPKARAYTAAFLGQWLGFAGLGTEHVPDAKKFSDFTPGLAEAMKLEPVLVFENLLSNGGSLERLLDGRDTFANSELAALYELPDVESADMRPVKHTEEHRGGLLGMAAILTASATPNRTSPVLRGKWVLENLLGRHLAEPPADAGQLDDKAGDRGKTLREELAEHRRQESCAGCHDKIDPIGFGLENFDAIGRYRAMEAGKPVDASGVLPGGFAFNGPAELRALVQNRYQDEFITNLTRRLTAFALGRVLVPQDEGLIRRLLAELKQAGSRADVLVEAIVLSEAFRTQGAAAED